jgi:hypothetical protein
MRKQPYLRFLLLLLAPAAAIAQQGTITYALTINGKAVGGGHPLRVFYKDGIAVIDRGGARKVREYIDYARKAVFSNLTVKGVTYTRMTPFDSLQPAAVTADTATILGHLCHRAHLVIRSNSIDVWFTRSLPVRGTPSPDIAPYLGTVLRVVRNGNFEMRAVSLHAGAPAVPVAIPRPGQLVDEATFQARLIRSRYTSVSVFTDQQINFGDSITAVPAGRFDRTYRFSGGTVVLKRMHLPEHFRGQVFASLTQRSGGDAYDRTGCVFVIPTGSDTTFLDGLRQGVKALPVFRDHEGQAYQGIVRTKGYVPPVELLRFFTPFGVGAYNSRSRIAGYHWADSVTYTQEVTDMLPLLQKDAWVGVYIGNYDRKGHTVSLRLNYYPAGDDPDTTGRRWVMPLFNTLNLMEMSGQNYGRLFGNDSLSVRFYLPAGVSQLRLRYISTGHGGWDGGDEFNPRVNTLLMDGTTIFSFIPWRTDCATYRLENPSSGNFSNGLSSSDYSRSGWCPGSSTDPVYIPLPALKPGWHRLTVAIPQGKPAGTSFSFWNVSGCLTGRTAGK